MPLFNVSYITRDGVYELGRFAVLVVAVLGIVTIDALWKCEYWHAAIWFLFTFMGGPRFGLWLSKRGFVRDPSLDDKEAS